MEKIITKEHSTAASVKPNRHLIFLTGLYSADRLEEIKADSIGSPDNAANALQWKYVNGFDALGISQTLINAPYVGSFPCRYRKLWLKSRKFSHDGISEDYEVGFCNLSLVKKAHRTMGMRAELKRQLILNPSTTPIIVAYALTAANISLLRTAKKIRPDSKTLLVVPDLPEYMNTSNSTSILYKIAKKFEISYIKTGLRFVDRFVLLTEAMSELYDFGDRYVVSEGIVNESEYSPPPDDGVFQITYTGTLNERYGVKNLLDAFMKITKKDARLVICGDGDSRGYLEECVKKDKRIVYKGVVANREAIEIQKQSDVLINPRMNNEAFVKYSFPSKILEYMSVGRVVLTYKLSSFPKEYDRYLTYIPELSNEPANDIMAAIQTTSELLYEERVTIGKRNYVFTQKHRTARQVAEQVLGGWV